ncbi:hypothetical protein [Streptomyces sp. NPDC047453]|uniref:hypothetical protein n=1 Tax=Streptomyces sp. NPDC047453 TaxID=3154812 RepID=UPI0033E7258A
MCQPTGRQAAQTLAGRPAAEHQLTTTVYRNGARDPVRAWAKTATLTKSAVTYNAGALDLAHEAGAHMVEVFDGGDCGWTGHRDPDKAARTLRTTEDAARWPISTPGAAERSGRAQT